MGGYAPLDVSFASEEPGILPCRGELWAWSSAHLTRDG